MKTKPFKIFADEISPQFLTGLTSHLSVIDSMAGMSGYTFPRKNQELVVIVCIEGAVTLHFDSKTLIIAERQMLSLLPGHIIEGYSLSTDFKGFVIISSTANFDSFVPMMSRMFVCSLHFKDNPVVTLTDDELANQMLFRNLLCNKINHAEGMFDSIIINKLCEGTFCETLNIYFKRFDGEMSASSRRSDILLYRFITLIEKNFAQERSVSFYADMLCVTPKHLSAAVKEVSGRTASQWIESYVIDEIKRLLGSTELTIQEISCRLKFPNQSFFGKYFKSHTGISPRQYRASLAEKGFSV